MIFTKFMKAGAVAGAAILMIAATGNWNANVVAADRGHEIGNPDAEVTLTEFVSYSCPHCATFTNQGEPALQMVYISSGKLKFEIRPVIRNDVDLTATLLVQCGEVTKFTRNHTMFMINQPTWLAIAANANPAQQNRWAVPDRAAARRSIASDLGFYGLMETRGYSRPAIDRCLADETEAKRLEANTQADFDEFKLKGTPSFAINGATQEAVSNWKSLELVLREVF